MMSKLDKFIDYLLEQVKNHSIYIWGGQGQSYPTVTEKWIKSKESGTNRTKALKTFRAAVKAGFEKLLRAFDCSGLGMYWVQNLMGLSKSDMNANGMKGKCTLIQKSHVKKGDWLFRCYKTGSKKGRAYHIGYMVSDTEFVEARGRAYGVVKRKLADVGSYWNVFGRPSYFKNEIDTIVEQIEHACFNRNLKKGCSGDDVRELQILLNAAGDDIKVDGYFGSKTVTAVKEFQRRKGLKVNGIAGKKTIEALGGTWAPWSITRILKRGHRGDDVKDLQRALIAAGYSCGSKGADGDFGEKTEKAVLKFQKAKGLKQDGIAGQATVTALGGTFVG